VHFTDVTAGGEMTFDYRLRPGRATTSNALRLLELAGIDVSHSESPAVAHERPSETVAAGWAGNSNSKPPPLAV
jgi:DNA mismatch repair ATPase MutS